MQRLLKTLGKQDVLLFKLVGQMLIKCYREEPQSQYLISPSLSFYLFHSHQVPKNLQLDSYLQSEVLIRKASPAHQKKNTFHGLMGAISA